MRTKLFLFAAGFVSACIIGIGSIITILFFFSSTNVPIYHDQELPSGKKIKVLMMNLAWGIDHDDRRPQEDCFVLDYVSTSSELDSTERDRETLEAFELIRPVTEQWGFDYATIQVYPILKRQGTYHRYVFQADESGTWTFTKEEAKVRITDP